LLDSGVAYKKFTGKFPRNPVTVALLGAAYGYQNVCVLLVSDVVESLNMKGYAQYVQERIFAALGSSGFSLA